MDITVDTTDVEAKLRILGRKMSNVSPLLKSIAQFHLAKIRKTFETEGQRDEHPRWAEFSPASFGRKRPSGKRITDQSKLLQDTGELKKSFRILNQTPMTIVWGSELDYAEKHQSGDQTKKLPKREMVFLTDNDYDMINNLINNWVEKTILSVSKTL
jgi:phage gpG-like protein